MEEEYGGGDQEEKMQQETTAGEAGSEAGQDDDSERGRPSTPKWWRPPIPPETYKWEEVRRQRQKGGYPWTHLDKDEEIDADDYLDDNLYEPVNPPPLYGNDSYLSKDLQQVPQTEERMIEIPPEIEAHLLTSEGLDGLDKPDPHDVLGFDGDREWQNVASEDEGGGRQSRSSLGGGIRHKSGESRSTTPKSVGFSPDTITHVTPVDDAEEAEQEVPREADGEEPSSSRGTSSRGRRSRSASPGRKQTAFDILKSKATDVADHVRQRLKSAIPVRPKFTKSRKRRKTKHGQEEEEAGEQEVPEDVEMKEDKKEELEVDAQAEKTTTDEAPQDTTEDIAGESSEKVEEEDTVEGEDEEGAQEEGKLSKKEEKEKKKAEEKAEKLKAAEEAKKAKLEEKLTKAREAEEKRQAKAEEEKRKQEEKEEAARKAAEAKKAEEERKAAEKAAKEEEARKVAEAKKAEEEAKKAAEKAKKEEEARIAAEKKKVEEEKKAAEKAKKEEEAKKAAEAKKAEEEKKAAEKAKKDEEAKAKKAAEEEIKKEAAAKKAEEAKELAAAKAKEAEEAAAAKAANKVDEIEEIQPLDITEGEEAAAPPPAEGGNEEAIQEEEMETVPPTTPSGTTKRKYIKHRKGEPIQLSKLPNPIASLRNQVEDFKNKLKRSRTPPRRHVQRKQRRSRSADASKSPPRDPDEVSTKTEEDEADATMEGDQEQQQKSLSPGEEAAAETKSVTASVASRQDGDGEAQTEEPAPPSSGGGGTGTTGRRRRQAPAKEKLDKIGAQLKGLGAKTFGVASMASKEVGQTLKAVGKLGSKAVGELKPSKTKGKPAQESVAVSEVNEETVSASVSMEAAPSPLAEPTEPSLEMPPEGDDDVTAPKRTFRFKRRGESQDEEEDEEEHFYENAQEVDQERNVNKDYPFESNALLGSGARDWESPQDRARESRGDSEERISGRISSRDSPPGSSLASSTVGGHVRRPGVLEEIDSDEFFLRERGISEGEDAEEVNRFLVEELRQAFRPSLSNALAGFDMEPPLAPPSRPVRAPRKPPRKDKVAEDVQTANPSMYQTFPPERPKRKQPQGYVSKFMKEHPEEGEEEGEYSGSNEEVRGSVDDMGEEVEEEEEEDVDDALQQVKDKLNELDRELEGHVDQDATSVGASAENQDQDGLFESPLPPSNYTDDYEDDGRYEPISDGPTKPTRMKRKKPKRPPTPPSFYYNTIAGNEWLREMEETNQGSSSSPLPAAPVRKRRGSGKSSSLPPASDDEQQHQMQQLQLQHAMYTEPTSNTQSPPGSTNEGDYVDEAGYAIVQKDRESLPKTIPRKKKKRTNLQCNHSQQSSSLADASFFSLPRPEPPSRPNRTYSTLRPRRPPRSKSGSRQNLQDIAPATPIPSKPPIPGRREVDDQQSRPSTAIGIMQGRPLPPPPRPQRSPQPPLGEIDQSSIEMSVGLRHYANFDDIEARTLEETLPPGGVIEVDIACQTDPVPDDEFIVGLPAEEDSGRIRTAPFRLDGQETHDAAVPSSTTTTGDVSSSSHQSPTPQQPNTQQRVEWSTPPPGPSPIPSPIPPFTFPTRLHLEELEVDFLRVNELIAHSIKVENLMQASQLEVNTMRATGPVSVSRLQTQSLTSDQLNCSRLSRDTVDHHMSDPPSSYYQLHTPQGHHYDDGYDEDDDPKALNKQGHGSEQELLLKAGEQEEKENESACTPPHMFDDSLNNLVMIGENGENVDSTNHVKCSHVAEKIVDKQLNLPDSLPSPTEQDNYSKPDRTDVSVGTRIPSTEQVPPPRPPRPPTTTTTSEPLNNLNQITPTSTITIFPQPELEESPPPPPRRIAPAMVTSLPPRPPMTLPAPPPTQEVEEEEPIEEENVVCGSYTLPYSYMPSSSPQSPSPSLNRKGSMKKSQPQPPMTLPSPAPRRSSSDHVAFGHTSVAQGEVLSVKLSIPVELGSIGQLAPTPSSPPLPQQRQQNPTTPPVAGGVRPPPRAHHGASASSAQLPESAGSQADSLKKDAVKSEPVPSSTSSAPTPARLTPSPPPVTPSVIQGDLAEESGENFFSTSVRLGRALMRFTMRALQAMADYIDTAASDDPAKAEQQRANMQVLLCLLLFLLVGLILATARSSPYSSPRWEFLMPPPDI